MFGKANGRGAHEYIVLKLQAEIAIRVGVYQFLGFTGGIAPPFSER